MSDRVARLFQRFDADVHDRMMATPEGPGDHPGPVPPADREEVLLLMHGLCWRAALIGFGSVGAERLAPLAASEMVDLILEMRDAFERKRQAS